MRQLPNQYLFLSLFPFSNLLRSLIPRYLGPQVLDKSEQEGGGAWQAEAVGGARPKRPSLPGNLGTLEPEDQRLQEVSEDLEALETQSDAGAGFLSSRYNTDMV